MEPPSRIIKCLSSFSNNSSSSAILLLTRHFQKKDSTLLEVSAGSLLNLVEKRESRNNTDEYVFDVMDSEKHIRVTCTSLDEFRSINAEDRDLLRPIPTCKERLEVFNDSDWLNDGRKLKVGDEVYVKLNVEQSEVPGILKFKGSNVPASKGIYFGVELKEKKGTCDGTFRGKSLFRTEQNCAVFVSLNKIRKSLEGWLGSIRMLAVGEGEGLYQQPKNSGQCKLSIGDRVVAWINDDEPEKGTVRWIGHLPDEPDDDITVGLCFDNPVGTGTGKYKTTQLFHTKQGHAALIPLIGLMKEIEFENTVTSNDPEPFCTSPVAADCCDINVMSPQDTNSSKKQIENPSAKFSLECRNGYSLNVQTPLQSGINLTASSIKIYISNNVPGTHFNIPHADIVSQNSQVNIHYNKVDTDKSFDDNSSSEEMSNINDEGK